jgi:ATP-dependent Clp protease adapter protein ClpS/Zn-dependent protease
MNQSAVVLLLLLIAIIYIPATYIVTRNLNFHPALKYPFGLTIVPVFVALFIVSMWFVHRYAPELAQLQEQAREFEAVRFEGLLALAIFAPIAVIGSWLWYMLVKRLDWVMFDTPQHRERPPSPTQDAGSRRGYFEMATIRGVPLFIHWSFPVGGITISLWGGFDLEAAAYYCFGYIILVGIHEFGHAAAARWSGLDVFAIEISGVGGACHIEAPRTVREAFLVYAAGLLAQLLLLALTALYVAWFGFPVSLFGKCMAATFLFVNVFMLVMNLIPLKESDGIATDGYVLLRLMGREPLAIFEPVGSPLVDASEMWIASSERSAPKDFATGVEILNDHTTPMDFVVDALMNHMEKSREEAVEIMLAIHERGGVLISTPTMRSAMRIAARISVEARKNGYALICRAVSLGGP